jgi:hypothetical protein
MQQAILILWFNSIPADVHVIKSDKGLKVVVDYESSRIVYRPRVEGGRAGECHFNATVVF